MTTKDLCVAMHAISARIDENKDALVRLDQQNGDGDLGISMSDGFHATASFLHTSEETDWGKSLNQCGNYFNEAAPSSLGTILAFFMKGMAKRLKGMEVCSAAQLADAMRAGLENVMSKAGSKPGEKTILDSLTPGVEALAAHTGEGAKIAFAYAAQAARAGSEQTKRMKAVWGRAAYYGEKSIGVLDGGSVVGALIFEAIQDL